MFEVWKAKEREREREREEKSVPAAVKQTAQSISGVRADKSNDDDRQTRS
jgi:hypothetical protein